MRLSLEALGSANRLVPGALARIALTAAVTCCYSGDWSAASEWFRRSRAQALVHGDRLAVSSVLHNIATYHVHALRLSRFCGLTLPGCFEFVQSELDSSKNYDDSIGLLSLGTLEPIVHAQSSILRSRFGEALEIIADVYLSLDNFGLVRYKSIILADRLLCKVRLQINANVSDAIVEIMAALSEVSDFDDRALVYGILSVILREIGQIDDADKYSALCGEAVSIHETAVAIVRTNIEGGQLNAVAWSQLYGR